MATHPHDRRDRERRETVERYHRLKDAEEAFALAKARATSPEERQALSDEMHRFRREHRDEDVQRGKRSPGPGVGIVMHQIMWARWIEIASQHEKRASAAHAAICDDDREYLLDELRESLVTVPAAASTVEALFEDTKYLIPQRPRKSTAANTIADGLAAVFGLPELQRQQVMGDLTHIFDRRNEGLHGYSEPMPPAEHPAGFQTGSEASRFNGPESRKALDLALRVLSYAERPPLPANRWVSRWVEEREAYHQRVVKPIREALERVE